MNSRLNQNSCYLSSLDSLSNFCAWSFFQPQCYLSTVWLESQTSCSYGRFAPIYQNHDFTKINSHIAEVVLFRPFLNISLTSLADLHIFTLSLDWWSDKLEMLLVYSISQSFLKIYLNILPVATFYSSFIILRETYSKQFIYSLRRWQAFHLKFLSSIFSYLDCSNLLGICVSTEEN